MIAANAACLTVRDQQVLAQILATSAANFDQASKLDDAYSRELPREQREALLGAESAAIRVAEVEGDLVKALQMLTVLVEQHPRYTSAWNNRAQVRQLLHDREGALADLDRALAIRPRELDCEAVKRAFSQRATLHMSMERQDEARRDFEQAAQQGDPFAKQQLTLMNPYAALCNQYIGQLLRKQE